MHNLPKILAVRKKNPVITVLFMNTRIMDELVRDGVLTHQEDGFYVHSSHNINPSLVNVGDYLRIDNAGDIYPINPEYFEENFNVVAE